MDFIDDSPTLDEAISSLVLELSTVDAGDAKSNDLLYANVVFADGTRLYEPFNRLVAPPSMPPVSGSLIGPLPHPGATKKFELPVPPGLNRTIGEISEFFLRKDGDDGWFVGILLSGDNHINQIYHVNLPGGRIAPEFVSSPLTLNTGLIEEPETLTGEQVASFPTGEDHGKRGFTTVTIDTSNAIPDGNSTFLLSCPPH